MATNGTSSTNGAPNKVFLIWGGEGWVAGHLKELLQQQNEKVFTTTVRMENREAVIAELDRVKPTHVLNCAGCTGRPNVDWCEDNKEQVIRSNVIGTLNLTDCCFLKNVHCTVFATGCTSIFFPETLAQMLTIDQVFTPTTASILLEVRAISRLTLRILGARTTRPQNPRSKRCVSRLSCTTSCPCSIQAIADA